MKIEVNDLLKIVKVIGGEDMFLKVLAFLIIAVGAILVFGAKTIVEKRELDKKIMVDFENEMTEEEVTNYKKQRAVVNVKMIGMIVALPGLVMVLLLFK